MVLESRAWRRNVHWFLDHLTQRSLIFLAPGTHFVEDNFSTKSQGGDGSGGNASDREHWGG